jgi:hypothetical protein
VPSAFQASHEASFDFWGDVAVGLDDAIVESVAEATGLGDLGDAVGDHPGFVAVS